MDVLEQTSKTVKNRNISIEEHAFKYVICEMVYSLIGLNLFTFVKT